MMSSIYHGRKVCWPLSIARDKDIHKCCTFLARSSCVILVSLSRMPSISCTKPCFITLLLSTAARLHKSYDQKLHEVINANTNSRYTHSLYQLSLVFGGKEQAQCGSDIKLFELAHVHKVDPGRDEVARKLSLEQRP
jgi:hypothetical protein